MKTDFIKSLQAWRIWLYLSIRETRSAYQQTLLGPWWGLINNIFMLLPVCFIFRHLMATDNNYYIFAITGMITWTFISGSLSQLSVAFVNAGGYLKEIPIPFCTFILKQLFKNTINFMHGLVIIIPLLFYFRVPIHPSILFVLPGLIILWVILFCYGILLALMVTRFRDFYFIIPKILSAFFFISPIVWQPKFLSPSYHYMVALNPFNVMIDLIRKPIIGEMLAPYQFLLLGFIVLLGVGSCMVIFSHLKNRLIFWI